MLAAIVFAVSVVAYGVDGKAITAENGVQLPCDFHSYDVNGDASISAEEFQSASKGFTKMDPKTLFDRLDKNGEGTIGLDEFTNVDSSFAQTGIFDHCARLRCFFICIHIQIG